MTKTEENFPVFIALSSSFIFWSSSYFFSPHASQEASYKKDSNLYQVTCQDNDISSTPRTFLNVKIRQIFARLVEKRRRNRRELLLSLIFLQSSSILHHVSNNSWKLNSHMFHETWDKSLGKPSSYMSFFRNVWHWWKSCVLQIFFHFHQLWIHVHESIFFWKWRNYIYFSCPTLFTLWSCQICLHLIIWKQISLWSLIEFIPYKLQFITKLFCFRMHRNVYNLHFFGIKLISYFL